MKLRIVLIPEERLGKISKDYSKLLNQQLTCKFQLDDINIPHITILHPDIEEKNLDQIISSIEKVVSNLSFLKLQVREVTIGGISDWIEVQFQDESEIVKMKDHLLDVIQQFVLHLNPYRVAHLTLTRLKFPKDYIDALGLTSGFPKEEFEFRQIAICNDGPDGTCSEVFGKFNLK